MITFAMHDSRRAQVEKSYGRRTTFAVLFELDLATYYYGFAWILRSRLAYGPFTPYPSGVPALHLVLGTI